MNTTIEAIGNLAASMTWMQPMHFIVL
jgi:hypothetical protein